MIKFEPSDAELSRKSAALLRKNYRCRIGRNLPQAAADRSIIVIAHNTNPLKKKNLYHSLWDTFLSLIPIIVISEGFTPDSLRHGNWLNFIQLFARLIAKAFY
jgi:hypothetical protein